MYWDTTGDWRLNYYNELSKKNNSSLTEAEKLERELDIIEKKTTHNLLNKGSINTILDIGCGVGRQIIEFAQIYPQIKFTGIDISKYQIELLYQSIVSKKLYNVNAYEFDASKLEQIKLKFDLITFFNNSFGCMDTYTQIKCLEQLSNHINEKGYLILSCFDRIDIAEKVYKEWGFSSVKIDYFTGIIDLGKYKSSWKTSELFLPYLMQENISFKLVEKISVGLGTLFLFRKIN